MEEKRALSPDLILPSTNELTEEELEHIRLVEQLAAETDVNYGILPKESAVQLPKVFQTPISMLHSNSSSSSADTVIERLNLTDKSTLTEAERERIRQVEEAALEAEELQFKLDQIKSLIPDRPPLEDSEQSSPITSSPDTVVEHESENEEEPDLVENWPIEEDDYSHIPTSPDHFQAPKFEETLLEELGTTQNAIAEQLETSDSCYEILNEVPDRPASSPSTSSADTLVGQEEDVPDLVDNWPIEADDYGHLPTSPDVIKSFGEEKLEETSEYYTGHVDAQQLEQMPLEEGPAEVQTSVQPETPSTPTSSADSVVSDEEGASLPGEAEKQNLPGEAEDQNLPREVQLTDAELQQIEMIQRMAETMGLVDSKYHGLIDSSTFDQITEVPLPEVAKTPETPHVLPVRPPPPRIESVEVPLKEGHLLTEEEIEHIRKVQEYAEMSMMEHEEVNPEKSIEVGSVHSSKTSSADSPEAEIESETEEFEVTGEEPLPEVTYFGQQIEATQFVLESPQQSSKTSSADSRPESDVEFEVTGEEQPPEVTYFDQQIEATQADNFVLTADEFVQVDVT